MKEESVSLENVRFRWKKYDFAPMPMISGLKAILAGNLRRKSYQFCFQPQNKVEDGENRGMQGTGFGI